jgi:hypothetical protein
MRRMLPCGSIGKARHCLTGLRQHSSGPFTMRREESKFEFPLPPGLVRLLATGVWPSADGPSMTSQDLNPLIPEDRVRRFAADENLICLERPPFMTIAQVRALGGAGDFWERCGALDQIVAEKALMIGDFSLGSDSPIILDFARHASNPPVLRLRWRVDGKRNGWVEGARDFDEFAEMLGLAGGPA